MKISMFSSRVRACLAASAISLCAASILSVRAVQAQETAPPVVEAPPADSQAAQKGDGDAARATSAKANIAAPVTNVQVEPDPTDGVGHPAELRPPVYSATDSVGVNLITGGYSVSETVNSIGGAGARGLASTNNYFDTTTRSSPTSYLQLSDDGHYVFTNIVLEGESLTFRNGSIRVGETTGTLNSSGSEIVYTGADGRVATFEKRVWSSNNPTPIGLITSLTYPTGEKLTFSRTTGFDPHMKVESSLGYAMVGSSGGAFSPYVAPVTANLKNGGCDATQCSGPTYADEITRGRGLTGSVSAPVGAPFTITFRNATGDNQRTYVVDTTTDDGKMRVTSFTDGVSTWTYSYNYVVDTWSSVGTQYLPTDGLLTTTATDPLGKKRIVVSRTSNGHVISDTDSEGRVTTYQYIGDDQGKPGAGKIQQVTLPEGDRFWYVMDGNLNVTAKWHIPKGTPAGVNPEATTIAGAVVERAGYSCRPTFAGGQNCKSPDWTRDARGNQTDYGYDSVTGELSSVTQPTAPNTKRPQIRFEYGTFTARYIVNGAWVTGAPVRRVTKMSACATGEAPACVGTADETVTQYAYEDGSQPNNVRLVSKTVRAGDNSLSATTTYAYNDRGDVTVVDGPLAGTSDVVQSYYDDSRWEIGQVTPDPDGSGPLLYRASKTDYRADGQVSTAYVGTVTSPSLFPSGFQNLTRTVNDFDAQARVVLKTTYGTDGSAVAQSAYGFDILGRLTCSTVRMNPAAFGSTPDACILGAQGADGPDRITYSEYDTIGRLTKVTSGYGVDPRVEKAVTYTANSQEQTVADGKGNLTTYEYDGLDRLAKVRYPNASGGGSSTTDYDGYCYDEAGNRKTWRRRDSTAALDCSVVTFTYDALNRVQNGLRGEAYGYDNLGRRTSATYGGGATTATYDALGRMTGETTNGLTMSYEYDPAGRRTKITWPDSAPAFYVTYGYDASGAMTGIYEQGVTRIAAYAYDDLGRRDYAWQGVGAQAVSEDYGYDAASRLSSLVLDQAGTAQDQTWTFAYNAAGQIKTRTATNSLYEWSGSQSSKAYTVNGLNQYATAAGTAMAYDARGNLSGDGTTTYCYDLLNNLTSAGTAGLVYEPMGRLWSVASGGAATRFLYSGSDLVAEYNGATLLRRYVPGPGTDAPVAWYEGAGVADRRWLLADPQGSIVAVANAAGVAAWTNTYDEYGVPAAGNVGRFQYTGQIWLPEAGLYHYKARAYSPTLGRFLQTDPSGYNAGLNWYAYVGNDPLNRTDPTGLRPYTKGELSLLRSIFGSNVPYSKVDIKSGSGLNLIAKAAFAGGTPAITLGHTIYVRPNYYSADMSVDNGSLPMNPRELISHETTHIWQYKNVIGFLLGPTKIAEDSLGMQSKGLDPYDIQSVTGETDFGSLHYEQQAQVVGDSVAKRDSGDAPRATELEHVRSCLRAEDQGGCSAK
ncbi:RHS repeat-associated core domain-containing protein [Caulobacter sp. UNC279MFTsu5.1]|uniref:RHS repeat-associated core domain-containing protein n=1 Tax=Caulobacter sp. UNC279MFTsu5.1 TaxID=1502775 RepID=UPI0008F05914|nr:RHS repeat-associated core domain-containing protein [Caulobacter sp. UNC279MFTsu5.1]SFK68504.1 RHS repeat-associated core domain-containing protein [Caulobacter sp. UNC279MFTsu5.1]